MYTGKMWRYEVWWMLKNRNRIVKQNIVKKLTMNQPLSNCLAVWMNQRFSHRLITVYRLPTRTSTTHNLPCEQCYITSNLLLVAYCFSVRARLGITLSINHGNMIRRLVFLPIKCNVWQIPTCYQKLATVHKYEIFTTTRYQLIVCRLAR